MLESHKPDPRDLLFTLIHYSITFEYFNSYTKFKCMYVLSTSTAKTFFFYLLLIFNIVFNNAINSYYFRSKGMNYGLDVQ